MRESPTYTRVRVRGANEVGSNRREAHAKAQSEHSTTPRLRRTRTTLLRRKGFEGQEDCRWPRGAWSLAALKVLTGLQVATGSQVGVSSHAGAWSLSKGDQGSLSLSLRGLQRGLIVSHRGTGARRAYNEGGF